MAEVAEAVTRKPRVRREVPTIPGHVYSPSVTEWTRKTVQLVTEVEKGEEAEVMGELSCTPETGWVIDERLVNLVGPQPAFNSLTDAKINLYKAYDDRHLVAERREAKIQALMEMGLSRELAEQAEAVFTSSLGG